LDDDRHAGLDCGEFRRCIVHANDSLARNLDPVAVSAWANLTVIV
jgi:hypothetical protein